MYQIEDCFSFSVKDQLTLRSKYIILFDFEIEIELKFTLGGPHLTKFTQKRI